MCRYCALYWCNVYWEMCRYCTLHWCNVYWEMCRCIVHCILRSTALLECTPDGGEEKAEARLGGVAGVRHRLHRPHADRQLDQGALLCSALLCCFCSALRLSALRYASLLCSALRSFALLCPSLRCFALLFSILIFFVLLCSALLHSALL